MGTNFIMIDNFTNLDENTIKLFTEQSHDIFMRFDKECHFTYISSTIRRLYPITEMEMVGKRFSAFNFSVDENDNSEELIQNVFNTGESFRTEFKSNTKYGVRTFLWKLFPEKDENNIIKAVLGIAKDITPYREISTKYATLFAKMTEGFAHHQIITDDKGIPIDYRFLEVNPAFENVTGLKSSDILGYRVRSVLPDTEQYWIDLYGNVALRGEAINFINYSKELNKYFDVTAFQSEPGYFATIFKDVTTEKKLQDLHKGLVDSITDTLVIIDKSYNIIWANEIAKASFGEDMVGRKCYEVYHNLKEPCTTNCKVRELLASKPKIGNSDEREYEVDAKTGLLTFLKKFVVINSPIKGNDYAILEIGKDITDWSLNKIKLAHSEKMMAIGQLAGGIAHDFNNMIMAMQGFINFARDTMDKSTPQYSYLSKAIQASERSASLVKQILTFSRQTKENTDRIFLLPSIKEAISLLEISLPSSLKIEKYLCKEKKVIDGNPTKIHEIIVNLCTNASHAMNGKGLLNIEHFEEDIKDIKNVTTGTLAPGTYSIIKVKDSGSGIDNVILNKIFDPFFSTKSMSEGTGMGLSVVMGVVKSYNGEINVITELGKGTEFTIFLPKIDIEELSQDGKKSKLTKGTENIMLVDDENLLLETVEIMLENLGYNVFGYNDSEAALKDFLSNPSKYSCIITDNIMPKLTGIELVEQIRKNSYSVPVIISTGFSSAVDQKKMDDLNVKHLILKPFSATSISKKLRNCLDNQN